MATTVLIVDDEPILRESIATDLAREGYSVFSAQNGAEALNVVKTQNIDLIISDVRMPGGDGIFLLEKLRPLRKEGAPRVILMTAFSELSLEECIERGANALLSKPFHRRTLNEMIAKILDQE